MKKILIVIAVAAFGLYSWETLQWGTHIHHHNQEGAFIGLQDSNRCPEGLGYMCEGLDHSCDGDFVVMVSK